MAAKTTELEAVNICLNVIGEASINTLTGTLPFEVTLARNIIDEASRELCQDSYIFNTEKDVVLTSDGTNVAVPAHYIIVKHASINYIIRGAQLYNMDDGTLVIPANVTADVTYLLDFEDLPEAAKRYVNIKAARVYADRLVGSKDIRAFTERDEMQAKAQLTHYQEGTGDFNMLTHPDVVAMLNRRI